MGRTEQSENKELQQILLVKHDGCTGQERMKVQEDDYSKYRK